jgi:chromosome segregation ATPase
VAAKNVVFIALILHTAESESARQNLVTTLDESQRTISALQADAVQHSAVAKSLKEAQRDVSRLKVELDLQKAEVRRMAGACLRKLVIFSRVHMHAAASENTRQNLASELKEAQLTASTLQANAARYSTAEAELEKARQHILRLEADALDHQAGARRITGSCEGTWHALER